ncbi:MAG: cytochrome c oxidase subunit I [Caulobacter sp.]
MSSETGFDPALYDRFPTRGRRPAGELDELKRIWCAPKGWEYVTAINNNFVGVYYVGAALLFFVLAGVLALLIRTQLALPLNGLLDQDTYNQIFTMHGTVMMFLFAVPAVEAMGVLLLPQMLAARDLPFPRLSAYAFWAYLIGGLCFFASIFVGLAPDGGWFMYPPLTSKAYSPGINADFWLLGIGFIEISAIAGAVEIIVGVMKTRAPGMTLDRLPVFAWAMLVFAVMIIIGFPAIILGTLLLELERALGWPFFDALKGGDPMLWQHLFWFFGHPEVYIIFLPAAGMLSMILPTIARQPLVGYRLVVLALIATGFISFGVWAHHMFATGMPAMSVSFFSAASMAVSVPAGVQVFAWIATAASGKYQFNTPGLFCLGALIVFTMGGLTGVMVALVPFDWQAHDTYFIVAHLHYVLIGGMVFPLFAAIYYWMPMVSKRPLSERWGRWVFWLMFAGMHIAFLPMHLTGLMGMPRRVYTYQPEWGWDLPNMISTVGAFVLGAGVLVFVVDIARNFRFSADESAGDLWKAGTLEWLPNGLYSVRSLPIVTSRYPLWDQPNLGRDVAAGRYFLPNAPTGTRETLVTSPIKAEPQYLMRMPVPGWAHVGAAVGTAAFFMLLTIQLYIPAIIGGLTAIACTLRWVWALDERSAVDEVDVGAGVMVPTYGSGPTSHGWWATVTVLTVFGMIFAMLVFSYVFLWSRQPEVWAITPAGFSGAGVAAAYLLAGATAVTAWKGLRGGWMPGAAAGWLMALAAMLLAAGCGLDFAGWLSTPLRPADSGYGAVVYAVMSLVGCLAAVGLLMGGYMAARAMAGRVDARHTASADIVMLFLAFTAAQGLIGLALTRLFPGAV